MPTLYIIADIAHYDNDDRVAFVERRKQMALGNFIKQTCIWRNQVYFKRTIPTVEMNWRTSSELVLESRQVQRDKRVGNRRGAIDTT
jgi:hypothetical protein